MRIGEILVAHGLATAEQIDSGLARQQRSGGLIGATLVAMDVITVAQLLAALKFQREEQLSVELGERTLRRCLAAYGPSSPNTCGAHDDLARALLAIGRPADAVGHASAAVAGYTQTVGADHRWTRDAATLLAEAHRAASAAERLDKAA